MGQQSMAVTLQTSDLFWRILYLSVLLTMLFCEQTLRVHQNSSECIKRVREYFNILVK